MATQLNSFSSGVQSTNSAISDALKLTNRALTILFGVLFGLALAVLVLMVVGMLCPLTLDCFRCCGLIYFNWILINFGTILILLITAASGAVFVLAGNGAATVTNVLNNPSNYASTLTSLFGSQVNSCLQTPSNSFFTTFGITITATQQSVLDAFKSTATNYANTDTFKAFSTSSSAFIAATDDLLYNLSAVPGTGAAALLKSVNNPTTCTSLVNFVFNPAFCKGVALTLNSATITTRQAYCTQIESNNGAFTTQTIQPIANPTYVGTTTFQSIVQAEVAQFTCLDVSSLLSLQSYGRSVGPALATL